LSNTTITARNQAIKRPLSLLTALLLAPRAAFQAAAESGSAWRVEYDGKSLPATPWTAVGKPDTRIEEGALQRRSLD
jgi:hypothetical protein